MRIVLLDVKIEMGTFTFINRFTSSLNDGRLMCQI